MDGNNHSAITEFVLLGFTIDIRINIALFFIFLIIYLTSAIGNGLITCTILFNANLYSPMYFFLCNLSIIDFCYSSTATPRLLSDLFSTQRTISIYECTMQLSILEFMGGTECLLLALMAYDRFLAICRPLHYQILMRWSVCYSLITFLWLFSFIINVVPILITPLILCNQNQINHFMCQSLSIAKLLCADISKNSFGIFCLTILSVLIPFILIMLSYSYIISSVLKMSSTGRYKAFSTCTSHVVVVFLFFGTGMFTYFGHSSQYSSNQDKYISIFYVIVCPMLNPLIYSFSNREIKKAMKKIFSKWFASF